MANCYLNAVNRHDVAGLNIGPLRSTSISADPQLPNKLQTRHPDTFPNFTWSELANQRGCAARMIQIRVSDGHDVETANR
jgi:hypothetical protein